MIRIGLLAAVALAAVTTPALADRVVTHTTVVRHDVHRGPAHPRRQVCTVQWRNHHKIRRCFWR